jgi:UDP-N-acetylmuramate dehydrogenase
VKDISPICNDFVRGGHGEVKTNVHLSELTYWKIGGQCSAVFYPNSASSLQFILKLLEQYSVNCNIFGKTSNLLFTSNDIEGALIVLGKEFDYLTNIGKGHFAIGAGASVPWTSYALGSRGLSGLEHAIGIPGSFGGLLYMNGGSMRRAVGEVVKSVKVLNRKKNKIESIKVNDCGFSYRKSIFQNNEYIILEVEVLLSPAKPKEIKAEMLHILRQRRSKFPLKLPSCGSVFKSTPSIYESYGPPGKIIEDMGMKGLAIGGARISNEHANFIVNENMATSEDVMRLIEHVSDNFYRKTNIRLPTEVNFVDEALAITPISEYINLNVRK